MNYGRSDTPDINKFWSEMVIGEGKATYYFVPELVSDYDKGWVHCNFLRRRLGTIGLTTSEWYSKYVPNPGCQICKSEVCLHDDKVGHGWHVVCGSEECFHRSVYEPLANYNRERWKDPEYREQRRQVILNLWKDPNHVSKMSKLMTDRMHEMWNDPKESQKLIEGRSELRSSPEESRSRILGMYDSMGIKSTHVYVAVRDNELKFGVSYLPERRIRELKMELRYLSSELTVIDAADLEYDIAKSIPRYDNGGEYRDIKYLDDILSMIKQVESRYE